MQVIYGRGDSPYTLMTPATSITLDGLDTASKYKVTVRARTSAGPNEPIMENFWTQIESELTDPHTIGAVGYPLLSHSLPLFPLPSFPSSPPLPPHPLSLSPSPPLPSPCSKATSHPRCSFANYCDFSERQATIQAARG